MLLQPALLLLRRLLSLLMQRLLIVLVMLLVVPPPRWRLQLIKNTFALPMLLLLSFWCGAQHFSLTHKKQGLNTAVPLGEFIGTPFRCFGCSVPD